MDLVARPFLTADLPQINAWYIGHGQGPVSTEGLPPTGFIVDDVGAGFMYKTDAKLGILEFWVSNPKATSDERHRAFTAVGNELLKDAIKSGIARIWCLSSQPDIVERAKEWEFKPIGAFELLARKV